MLILKKNYYKNFVDYFLIKKKNSIQYNNKYEDRKISVCYHMVGVELLS